MKKNLIRFTALALVVVMAVAVLASCGGPSGTYGDTSGIGGVEYTFKGSKVTIKVVIAGFAKEFNGSYKMGKDDDGNKTITMTFEGRDASSYSGTHTYAEGKDDTGAYISLDGVKLYKK